LIVAFSNFQFHTLAQTEPGKTFIGGQTGLDLSFINEKIKTDDEKFDNGKSSSIDFAPQIGKFAGLNFLIGAILPISSSSETDVDGDKLSLSSWAIGPFARLYFGEGDTKLFLQAMGGLGSSTIKVKSEKENLGSSMYQIGAGLAIFVNKSLSLDIGLNYGSRSMKPSNNNNDFTLVSKALNVNLGFNFIL
jgi:hypothetical protein